MGDLVRRPGKGRRALTGVAVEVDELGPERRRPDEVVAREIEQAGPCALSVTKAGEPALVRVAEGRAVEEVSAATSVPPPAIAPPSTMPPLIPAARMSVFATGAFLSRP